MKKEPKIYVDIGIVDSNELSPDKVPDDFWAKLAWFEKYNKRANLELHIFKDNNVDLNRRLSNHKYICEIEDRGDYLSLTTNFANHLGNYEDTLTKRLIMLLQPGGEDDKYLLDTVNVCVYM